jgi:hypothetical protein
MPADTNRLRVTQDGLFTDAEHAVLAKWFRQREPASAAPVKLDDALAQLGFAERCEPYTRTAAAVAHILLEAIEDRLPVWACMRGDDLIQSRNYREPQQKPRRRAALLPSGLFGINWATSGPGFEWPVFYHLVWTPVYERFVVTASADCPDAFGYADFALGHFARGDDVGQSVAEIIKLDWTMQRDECSQERWEALIRTGLVKEAAVYRLADQVWPQDEDEEEDLNDDDGAPLLK